MRRNLAHLMKMSRKVGYLTKWAKKVCSTAKKIEKNFAHLGKSKFTNFKNSENNIKSSILE